MRYPRKFFIGVLVSLAAPAIEAQVPINPAPARILGHARLELTTASPNLVEGRELNAPHGVALDTSVSPPIIYVADTGNNRVLAWRDAASFSNGVKADLVIGQRDFFSTLSLGPGTNLLSGLSRPTDLAVDREGNLYVADSGNNRVVRYRRPFQQQAEIVLADFVIGQPGLGSRTANAGGLSSRSLNFHTGQSPLKVGLAFDAAGNLWVTDAGNHRVLRFPAGSLSANSPNQPDADLVIGQANFSSATPLALSTAAQVRLDKGGMREPAGVAVDEGGRVYVVDGLNRVLVFRPPFSNGMQAARLVGFVPQTQTGPLPPVNEYTIGLIQSSPLRFFAPEAVFCIGNKLFVVDTWSHRIVRFPAFDDWPPESVSFSPPAEAIIGQGFLRQDQPQANRGQAQAGGNTLFLPRAAVFGAGMTFVADSGNHRVLTFGNLLSGPPASPGEPYFARRTLGQINFDFNSPNLIEGREFFFSSAQGFAAGIAVDARSDPPRLYVADTFNNRVLGFADARNLRPGDSANLVIGQANRVDFFRSLVNYPTNQPGAPNEGGLFLPSAVAVDANGNLWVADQGNGRVLRYPDPFSQSDQIRPDLVLGQFSFTSRNTDATSRTMAQPAGLAFTVEGWLLVSDVLHNRVLLFQPPFQSGMAATKVFGQPDFLSTQPGSANNQMNAPRHIATDTDDRLYVADSGNNRILIFGRVLAPDAGVVFTLSRNLRQPFSVAVSKITGEIWVADSGNNRTLRYPRFDQLLGVGDASNLTIPSDPPLSLALDGFNNLLVADATNRVRFHFPRVLVLNGANFTTRIAPGMWTTLKTQDARLNQDFRYTFTEAQVVGNSSPIPKQLAGLQVLIDNSPAPVYFVSPFQINFLMPNQAPSSGTVELQVVEESTGRVISSERVSMSAAAPAFFTFGPNGEGQIAAINHADGSLNSPERRVARGEIISLFGTGVGRIPNAPPDGEPVTGIIETPSRPRVFVNFEELSQQDILFSGLAPGFAGLWQLNIRIPSRVPPGESIKVLVLMNDVPSNDPQRPPAAIPGIAVR
jgi:uncharacterized protein (TIGR03437 family)